MSNPVQVKIKDQIGWIIIDNPPVNATSTAVRAGLLAAIDQIQTCRFGVIKCLGRTFIAGGDMSEFDRPAEEPHLPDVVQAIEDSAVPIIALMHGNVLGGGFEIAMACTHRFAAPGTKFGLPEVNVGLIPGAGGTQRAPRLLGWEMAIDMACLGKFKSAEDLFQIGAVDAICEDLERAATAFKPKADWEKISHRQAPEITDQEWQALGKKVQKANKGQSAPLLNFEALGRAKQPFSQSQPKEREQHLALRQSDESRALRHVFFAERSVTKPDFLKDHNPRPLKTIALVGGGLMGSGIAAACLNADFRVCLIEQTEAAATAAEDRVSGLLKGALDRGKCTQAQFDARLNAFSTHTDYAISSQAELAIEAVFEDLAAKQSVFAKLVQFMDKDAILATNTSYLNPDEIFDGIINPQRCVGLHFFSPAHIMKLLEIVQAAHTSQATLSTAFHLGKKLRKMPILSQICDGFIGNRILAAYRRGAEYLVADGALPHEVDAAMRAFGMAMGPFEVQDLAGLQIAYANRRRQDTTRDPQQRYVTLLDQLHDKGWHGQRSGRGWYRYEENNHTPHRDEDVKQLILDYSKAQNITRRRFAQATIQNHLLAIMANEGAHIVHEKIAQNTAAVDLVKIHGYGFPRWRGGPMFWAELQGTQTIQSILSEVEALSPHSFERAPQFT